MSLKKHGFHAQNLFFGNTYCITIEYTREVLLYNTEFNCNKKICVGKFVVEPKCICIYNKQIFISDIYIFL